jgi:hypothetical protein
VVFTLFARYNTLLGSVGKADEDMSVVPPEGQIRTVRGTFVREFTSEVPPDIPSTDTSAFDILATDDVNEIAFSRKISFMLDTDSSTYADVNAVDTNLVKSRPVEDTSNALTYFCESTDLDSPVVAEIADTANVIDIPLNSETLKDVPDVFVMSVYVFMLFL